MSKHFGKWGRPVFVTKHSSGTSQLAQLLKCLVIASGGTHVALVGLDDSGDPVDVNDYVTMYVEKFPCEGNCWKDLGDPPLTDHLTIISPSLVARVCTEFGCGSFFYLDTIDAPAIAGLPYDLQKQAIYEQTPWFLRLRQWGDLKKATDAHRSRSRNYKRRKAKEKIDAQNRTEKDERTENDG